MRVPKVAKTAFVAPGAEVLGDVTLEAQSSVWFHATLRADEEAIFVGEASNIQDNCVLHVNDHTPIRIGRRVTVGHSVILHSCTIGDQCIIGMGSIVMDECVIGAHCIIGAGSLLTKGTRIPEGSMVFGRPAKVVRALTAEEIASIDESAEKYKMTAKLFRDGEVVAYHEMEKE